MPFERRVQRHGADERVVARVIFGDARKALTYDEREKRVKATESMTRLVDARLLAPDVVYSIVSSDGGIDEFKVTRETGGAIVTTTRELRLPEEIPGDDLCDGQCYYAFFYARMCRHYACGPDDEEDYRRWR